MSDGSKGRKLRPADKSWKSLDAGSLNKIYDNEGSGQALASTDLESYHASEDLTLPPPAKFSKSRLKLPEIEANDASTSCSTDTMGIESISYGADTRDADGNLSFTLDFPSAQEDFVYLAYSGSPKPISQQKAERRKLQRKVNFALGLQSEAERRKQGRSRW
jgi:hypothetical protein